MFESIPPADAILLKWILYDWNDEQCVKTLKKCKEAIIKSKGKEQKVIIIDIVLENEKGDDESIETQLFFDMFLMVCVLEKREMR
ncbi:Trans-resveratrol di-O-methyltransferase [Spatholobus suberectus]|nr:Trans-resveratrol di-O-methyltransferase [Spatholobus suberectus]